MDISFCICTFRRPKLLSDLLRALPAQQIAGREHEVIVIDNDPQRSADAALQAIQVELAGLPLRTHHVATPNIALARNAAVAHAQGEWLAIIDDDELPDPGWLQALWDTAARTQADAVFGPVYPRYPADTPTWITQGGFFEPAQRPTDQVIESREAYSGNVLIRRSALAAIPGPFDAEFGVTGGSDTMLFWEMQRQGAKLVWCAEARVSEDVPPSRLSLAWILRRSYRGGQSFVRAEVARLAGRSLRQRQLTLGTRALVQLPVAAILAVGFWPFSRARAALWLRTTVAQAGKITALFGHRYHEYAQPKSKP